MTQPDRSHESENAGRGNADLWLMGAFEMLLEGGIDSVRILPLAKKLGQSRTSFYWFFEDRDALLEALIARWREKNTGNLVRQAHAYAESLQEAVLNVTDCWFDAAVFDARLEFAMRSWALQSPAIALEIESADSQRIEALGGMFRHFGIEDGAAEVSSRALYLIQIGYISMQTQEDLHVRMSRLPHYVKLLTQRPPQPNEMDRFYARHGYSPLAGAGH
ncbi:TetR/AcrR family transcriptional regulator [Pseudomonas sp. NPDC090592]|uniref:TetR/AcrR family transcriptional regulator n=1 Tax=Pseudomonas sp. NPDC090592 TaxID=3364480 RepID=UPI00383B48D2